MLELTVDYRTERNNVWGVTARNREQNLALNLLMDQEIDFVTVLGPAGTGKTLLTLASGLAQTLRPQPLQRNHHDPRHHPVGRGHRLPAGNGGGEDGAVDGRADGQPRGAHPGSQPGGSWGRGATNDLLRHRIKIRSLNFMRGRTFLNRFIIIDEAQNLTPETDEGAGHAGGAGDQARCASEISRRSIPRT